jgi:hypothetical protein
MLEVVATIAAILLLIFWVGAILARYYQSHP